MGGGQKLELRSTVIDLTSKPKILRPGSISPNVIKKILKTGIGSTKKD